MKERRGFERARRVERVRRRELTGRRDDRVVNLEGASGGKAGSTGRVPVATAFSAAAAS